MKKSFAILIVTMLLWTAAAVAQFQTATDAETHNPKAVVCPDPAKSCDTDRFEPFDMSFDLAKDLKWQNAYYSVEFYAVLLKSMPAKPDDGPGGDKECGDYIKETERKSVQALFPNKKVFASRFGCSSHSVSYTKTNAKFNFLAVYAGKTKQEAQATLQEVKATKKFTGANFREIQVVYDFGD